MEIIKNLFSHDSSREYTDEELLASRKRYFQDYQLKEGETLTETYELVCKDCGGRRYYQNNNFVVTCRCTCQAQAAEEEERRKQAEKRMESLQKLKALSLLGKRYQNASFENLDLNRPQDFINAVERCKNYCKNWDEVKKQGLGIYLYGDVGTGKSLLTACIGNYLLARFTTVLFTNFFEIAKQIKKTFVDNSMTESAFIDRLTGVDLLIIDDLGTEIVTKNGEKTWLQDKIYDVINARYINQKPTIFSSNESLVDLVESCGLMKKTVDRIAAMSTAKIELRGSSYRLQEQIQTSVF